MSGNVWEWVNDWYGGDYYKVSPKENPPGPESGTYKVLRGGSWFSRAHTLRSADRVSLEPVGVSNYIGFRCAWPGP